MKGRWVSFMSALTVAAIVCISGEPKAQVYPGFIENPFFDDLKPHQKQWAASASAKLDVAQVAVLWVAKRYLPTGDAGEADKFAQLLEETYVQAAEWLRAPETTTKLDPALARKLVGLTTIVDGTSSGLLTAVTEPLRQFLTDLTEAPDLEARASLRGTAMHLFRDWNSRQALSRGVAHQLETWKEVQPGLVEAFNNFFAPKVQCEYGEDALRECNPLQAWQQPLLHAIRDETRPLNERLEYVLQFLGGIDTKLEIQVGFLVDVMKLTNEQAVKLAKIESTTTETSIAVNSLPEELQRIKIGTVSEILSGLESRENVFAKKVATETIAGILTLEAQKEKQQREASALGNYRDLKYNAARSSVYLMTNLIGLGGGDAKKSELQAAQRSRCI